MTRGHAIFVLSALTIAVACCDDADTVDPGTTTGTGGTQTGSGGTTTGGGTGGTGGNSAGGNNAGGNSAGGASTGGAGGGNPLCDALCEKLTLGGCNAAGECEVNCYVAQRIKVAAGCVSEVDTALSCMDANPCSTGGECDAAQDAYEACITPYCDANPSECPFAG